MRFDDGLRATLRAHLQRFDRLALSLEDRRAAAVAVVVVPDEAGEAVIVLTVRAADLRRHRGQWACPGGRLDPGETPEVAALRELEEEVGLPLPAGNVLGCLDDYPTRSGFVITPVAVWGSAEPLRPDPREVARIDLVPLELLAAENVVLQTIPQSDRPVLALSLPDGLLYAPTAAVLHQFAEVAVLGRPTRVAHYEQPLFAWR